MKRILLILIVAALAIGLGYFYNLGLPQYTFYLIDKSIKNHDVQSFYKYIDLDSIIENYMDSTWRQARHKDKSIRELSGLVKAMRPSAKLMLIGLARQEINDAMKDTKEPLEKEAVVEKTPIKYFIDTFKSLKQLSDIKIRTHGEFIDAEIPSSQKEENLTLKMRKTPQRYWKIIVIRPRFVSE